MGFFVKLFPPNFKISQNFISHINGSAVNDSLTVIHALLVVQITRNTIFLHFYMSIWFNSYMKYLIRFEQTEFTVKRLYYHRGKTECIYL